ncbi:hypothetical protein, partial [Streptomyces sp. SID3343]|uniref:hypothetical protein n=1 Tax=Streptomyces sp. SID3343 TaxID=2690260 RepID=UPI00136FA479
MGFDDVQRGDVPVGASASVSLAAFLAECVRDVTAAATEHRSADATRAPNDDSATGSPPDPTTASTRDSPPPAP